MDAVTQIQRNRTDRAARWTKAADRAISEGIQIRQIAGTGQWVATSSSDAAVAYEVQVSGNVAHGCDCLAGLNDDPVCKHRAAFYLLVGALDPEPEPPAPAAPDHYFRICDVQTRLSLSAGVGVALITWPPTIPTDEAA